MTVLSFNSLYLRFFHTPALSMASKPPRCPLSIPFTWDFSIHPRFCEAALRFRVFFQFPLLEIFPYTTVLSFLEGKRLGDFQFPLLEIFPYTLLGLWRWLCLWCALSIPFTWDFSIHPKLVAILLEQGTLLSIPFTWDFSIHPWLGTRQPPLQKPFNSLYLRFFHTPEPFLA